MATDLDMRLDGHTPTPWKFVPWHIEEGPPAVRAPEGWVVAHASSDADAEYIAHAANCHDELLSQLQYAVKLLGAFPALNGTAQVQSMRDTLAKAQGAA